MKVKILRYAAGRDDKIVSVHEDVTFENDYVGWYVDCPDERGHHGWDNIAVIERVGAVCFIACFVSRNALTADVFHAVTDEAQHLQAAMQQRMASGQWIPLTYVAAYEALGWDSRPLRCHRENIRRKRQMREQEC